MAWTSLATRAATLPLVLAGPILRRTEASSVSVWLALSEEASVTLRIEDESGQPMFERVQVSLRKFGPRLWIGVVSASSDNGGTALEPAKVYQYRLLFHRSGERLHELGDPGVFSASGGSSPFAYAPHLLPTFSLPSADVAQIRIAHGSCRKPHGPGKDALALLDQWISDGVRSGATEALSRPQLLFLTGDQIYADDVADALLTMLIDAAAALIGHRGEQLDPAIQLGPSQFANATDRLPPGFRSVVMSRAGFTASVWSAAIAKSHLISFGEYLMMYLFAWSDVLWGPELPSFVDVFSRDAPPPYQSSPKAAPADVPLVKGFKTEAARLTSFRATIPSVRKALANVPTYMIFDDHEITDDWYISGRWCREVLGGGGAQDEETTRDIDEDEAARLGRPAENVAPIGDLGRRAITNGIAAYAVCQAWGNTPGPFAVGAGEALLSAATRWAQAETSIETLARYVLPPKSSPLRSNGRLAQPEYPISWHWGMSFGELSILVLDGRTKRSCPGEVDAPQIIDSAFISEQLDDAPVRPWLLVVAPGPVFGVESIESVIQFAAGSGRKRRLFMDFEAWAYNRRGIPALLGGLATRAKDLEASRRPQGVVFLSGDVHYCSSIRVQYSATQPYGSTTNTPVNIVAAQLTCSSLKNEAGLTRGVAGHGATGLEAPTSTVRILGFNNPSGAHRVLGLRRTTTGDEDFEPITRNGSPIVVEREPDIEYETPDWSYQMQYVADMRPDAERVPGIGAAGTAITADVAQQKLAQARARTTTAVFASARRIVGHNNLATVRFRRRADSRLDVIHEISWRPDDRNENGWVTTRHEAALAWEPLE